MYLVIDTPNISLLVDFNTIQTVLKVEYMTNLFMLTSFEYSIFYRKIHELEILNSFKC